MGIAIAGRTCATRSGPGRGSGLVLRLSDGALDIAQALLGAALDLPTLAADLLLLAPGHLAEPFLDFAPGLAQRAFDVLIGHGNVPSAVLALVVRNPHTIEASPGARASGVPAAHASLSSRPNHVMTARHGAWLGRRLVRAQRAIAARGAERRREEHQGSGAP